MWLRLYPCEWKASLQGSVNLCSKPDSLLEVWRESEWNLIEKIGAAADYCHSVSKGSVKPYRKTQWLWKYTSVSISAAARMKPLWWWVSPLNGQLPLHWFCLICSCLLVDYWLVFMQCCGPFLLSYIVPRLKLPTRVMFMDFYCISIFIFQLIM